MKNMHFIAPEYGCKQILFFFFLLFKLFIYSKQKHYCLITLENVAALTPAIDIFSFGMCALEMAALEIQGNGDTGTLVTDEHIARTIEGLEDAQQKNFISKCLHYNPADRLNARELLFHSLLFEVHSLKLLAAHCLVNTARKCYIYIYK